MYKAINDTIREKTINLSYPIHSGREIAVFRMLNDNVQYQKMISSRTYAGRELLSMLEGMVELDKFLVDGQVIKKNELKGITEITLNSDELDNSDNLKDGRPSNSLLTYHVTSNEDFMSFEPQTLNIRNLRMTQLLL